MGQMYRTACLICHEVWKTLLGRRPCRQDYRYISDASYGQVGKVGLRLSSFEDRPEKGNNRKINHINDVLEHLGIPELLLFSLPDTFT